MTPVDRITKAQINEAGWTGGTTLENQVAHMLKRSGFRPGGHAATGRYRNNHDYWAVAEQHRAGRFRLDFAWPDSKIALEADGWHHRSPASAAKDAERDAWLRSEGWLVFRVDDAHGEQALLDQLVRTCRTIHLILDDMWRP